MEKKNKIWVYPLMVMVLFLNSSFKEYELNHENDFHIHEHNNTCRILHNYKKEKSPGLAVLTTINANDAGLFFGNGIQPVNPRLETGTVTDIEGNAYRTVKIGDQWWMAENLKVTLYNNGDIIGTTTPPERNIGPESKPKYQWAYIGKSLAGEESDVDTYGRLYTWYSVTDQRKICPTGWHVPSDQEWTTLTNLYGGDYIAADKLKEPGTKHWHISYSAKDGGATNESGFTALPGGFRYSRGQGYMGGAFVLVGRYAYWWSSTEYDSATAWIRGMYYDNSIVGRGKYSKKRGFAVRCVKDD